MSFFERTATVNGKCQVKIGALQLPPQDVIILLQTILYKKNANNSNIQYRDILQKAYNVLPKSGADNVQKIVTPVYNKIEAFISLLISMEDASPNTAIEWDQVEACLTDIDTELKRLFKEYYWTIYALKPALIRFFQSFLDDLRTRSTITAAFNTHSLSPILGQLIVNEYQDHGVTLPQIVTSSQDVSDVKDIDPFLLEEAWEKMKVMESVQGDQVGDAQNYYRDLDYLQVLQTEDMYYEDPHNGNLHANCRLSELSCEQLSELAQKVMAQSSSPDTLSTQRFTLQTLAILRELYFKITNSRLDEKQLTSILLALQNAKFELQWQLDASQTSPSALLLYISLLCLRGDIVHIEQAEQLLQLQTGQEQHLRFLQQIKIMYSPKISQVSTPSIGALHCRSLTPLAKTYYFGSQLIRFSEHPAQNLYLAQALLEMKQHMLQHFDAWYEVLWSMVPPQDPSLQSYREALLVQLDQTWMRHIHDHLPLYSLQNIDQTIELFQRSVLGKIWQDTEQKLCELSSRFRASDKVAIKRLEFLRTQSNVIDEKLAIRHYGRYAESLSVLPLARERVKHTSYARLYYDRPYLTVLEQMQCIHRYMKHHLAQIQRLCPDARRVTNHSEQLEVFIQYLAEHQQRGEFSAEMVAATTRCVHLYQSVNGLIKWSNDETLLPNMGILSNVTSEHACKTLAETMMTQLDWITQTNSLYFQYLESNTVKLAAMKLHTQAQRLASDPSNQTLLTDLLQTLITQQQVLSQLWWYVHFFGWLFGYADVRVVCAQALQHLNQMIALQQIPEQVWQDAQEKALCVPFLEKFQINLGRIQICAAQLPAWQIIIEEIRAIENNTFGYARMYELRDFLRTHRQKFMTTHSSFLYGNRQVDQIDKLLRGLDQAITLIEKNTRGVLADRILLKQKSQQVQNRDEGIAKVSIQPGMMKDYFFDMWITSKQGATQFKRFYDTNEFFAFVRKPDAAQDLLCEDRRQLVC